MEGYVCNVGNKEDRQKVLKKVEERYGRIDVLVPNAACSTHFGT